MDINGSSISTSAQAFIAGMVDDTGELDRDLIFADPAVWAEAQRFFPRHLFDARAKIDGDTWQVDASTPPPSDVPEGGAQEAGDAGAAIAFLSSWLESHEDAYDAVRKALTIAGVWV